MSSYSITLSRDDRSLALRSEQVQNSIKLRSESETVTLHRHDIGASITLVAKQQSLNVKQQKITNIAKLTRRDNEITIRASGLRGQAGIDGDKYYQQPFANSAAVTVTHNLGKKPAVTVVDSAGDQVLGNVSYVSDSELTVTFSNPTGGVIYCN